ncbi:hypothetical protein AOL_s00215g869 [Orbilia oligospora ATCC 24927]|uniref:Uncharacterized protein n=1 Tax=Arthrobotrys oligospora (strain ATCC 24927 / CBS 115.81 / DSM 1491) TaxID=756982 RepID=G1XV61_ARTOA|nr:hypothetical protein AOL_s00215g869 [Orbilia oligospora ATCC 24927]EGX42920.1 hypothetical protein AOL_s00215g869 [Orbilia oligospora ATCC 24927]
MPATTLPSSLPLELALLTSTPLPTTPLSTLQSHLTSLSNGDYHKILTSPLAASLLSPASLSGLSPLEIIKTYKSHLKTAILESTCHPLELLTVGIASLHAYLQATTTGPPLPLEETEILPQVICEDRKTLKGLKEGLVRGLSVDGESAYHLLPYPVVFTLAKEILTSDALFKNRENSDGDGGLITAKWWRVRVNFAHQRILREVSSSLHEQIYADLGDLEGLIFPEEKEGLGDNDLATQDLKARYLVERSTIHSFYGYDAKVRKDLESAAAITGLQYAITGRLGKRTKFQVDDISQLVVLARSTEEYGGGAAPKTVSYVQDGEVKAMENNESEERGGDGKVMPKQFDLNDDTLLEAISFTPATAEILEAAALPPSLSTLDPASQPMLQPIDSIILLHLAESIKNTNPADGLTREQMSPYAERVLQHSTNWSIHTMGLLVRSRLEAYRSRTVERSLLQLQVVVDQIVAATASEENTPDVSTFLPKPKEEESASVFERLEFAFSLGLPTRWGVEAELAARWVDMGGLRTAVGIYERLGMWAEVALCWAAVEKEEKAVGVVRRMLFEGEMPKGDDDDNVEPEAVDEDEEIIITDDDEVEPVERDPPPPEAPRLWCILGELEKNPEHFKKAWEVSGRRYARAQRSLGVYHLRRKEYSEAIVAYKLSLKCNPLNGPAWFQCGCAMLEVADWDGAVEAFMRVIGIDDTDAEGWSNLATALLRRGKVKVVEGEKNTIILDDEEEVTEEEKSEEELMNEGKMQALMALKKAVGLKNTNWRMWENVLVIAASLRPPVWGDMQMAIRRIVEIRGQKGGETCVDVELLEMLVKHVIKNYEKEELGRPGLVRMVVDLVDTKIVPLITGDERLWKIVGKLAEWRGKFVGVIETYEKMFRVVNGRYDVRTDKKSWGELVDATEEIVGVYRKFGGMERKDGLAAGSGAVVMKDWKFKGRSLVRNVLAKGRKAGWEEDTGLWERLEVLAEDLKN